MILLAPPFAFEKSFIALLSSIFFFFFFSFHALIVNDLWNYYETLIFEITILKLLSFDHNYEDKIVKMLLLFVFSLKMLLDNG